jgi:hypothetical protein
VEQTQGGLRYRKEVMAADEMRAAKEGRVYRLLRRWSLSQRNAAGHFDDSLVDALTAAT